MVIYNTDTNIIEKTYTFYLYFDSNFFQEQTSLQDTSKLAAETINEKGSNLISDVFYSRLQNRNYSVPTFFNSNFGPRLPGLDCYPLKTSTKSSEYDSSYNLMNNQYLNYSSDSKCFPEITGNNAHPLEFSIFPYISQTQPIDIEALNFKMTYYHTCGQYVTNSAKCENCKIDLKKGGKVDGPLSYEEIDNTLSKQNQYTILKANQWPENFISANQPNQYYFPSLTYFATPPGSSTTAKQTGCAKNCNDARCTNGVYGNAVNLKQFSQSSTSLLFPSFGLNTYSNKTPSTLNGGIKQILYNTPSLPFMNLEFWSFINQFKNKKNYPSFEYVSGLPTSKNKSVTEFFYSVTYSIAYAKINGKYQAASMSNVNKNIPINVDYKDIFNLLYCISLLPQIPNSITISDKDSSISKKSTSQKSVSLQTSNENNAYMLVQDWCYYMMESMQKLPAKENFASMSFTGYLPWLLQSASNNKNSLLTILNKEVQTYRSSKKIPSANPIDNYPLSKNIFLNYCSSDTNWKNSTCINFYKQMYLANGVEPLDNNVQELLFTKCKSNTTSENNPGLCSCFLTSAFYKNYVTTNRISPDVASSPIQCWYPPCFQNTNTIISEENSKSMVPFLNKTCPSQTICQSKINNILNSSETQKNNKILNQLNVFCPTSYSPTVYTSAMVESVNSLPFDHSIQEKKSVRLQTILITLLFVVVAAIASYLVLS